MVSYNLLLKQSPDTNHFYKSFSKAWVKSLWSQWKSLNSLRVSWGLYIINRTGLIGLKKKSPLTLTALTALKLSNNSLLIKILISKTCEPNYYSSVLACYATFCKAFCLIYHVVISKVEKHIHLFFKAKK